MLLVRKRLLIEPINFRVTSFSPLSCFFSFPFFYRESGLSSVGFAVAAAFILCYSSHLWKCRLKPSSIFHSFRSVFFPRRIWKLSILGWLNSSGSNWPIARSVLWGLKSRSYEPVDRKGLLLPLLLSRLGCIGDQNLTDFYGKDLFEKWRLGSDKSQDSQSASLLDSYVSKEIPGLKLLKNQSIHLIQNIVALASIYEDFLFIFCFWLSKKTYIFVCRGVEAFVAHRLGREISFIDTGLVFALSFKDGFYAYTRIDAYNT